MHSYYMHIHYSSAAVFFGISFLLSIDKGDFQHDIL